MCAEDVTAALTAASVDKRSALMNAHDYLTLMGHTCVAWQWMRSATAAAQGLQALQAQRKAGDPYTCSDEENFYRGKLQTCSFFFRHELPMTEILAARLMKFDPTVAHMPPGWF